MDNFVDMFGTPITTHAINVRTGMVLDAKEDLIDFLSYSSEEFIAIEQRVSIMDYDQDTYPYVYVRSQIGKVTGSTFTGYLTTTYDGKGGRSWKAAHYQDVIQLNQTTIWINILSQYTFNMLMLKYL